MGVREMDRFLEQWQMDAKALRRRMILAPTNRERALRQAQEVVRHAAVGPRLDRIVHGGGLGTGSPHHRPLVGRLRRGRACSLDIRADRWFHPALGETQQVELKAAVQELPEQAGIELVDWYWRGVRQFVSDRFGIELSRSSCLNYLHRSARDTSQPARRRRPSSTICTSGSHAGSRTGWPKTELLHSLKVGHIWILGRMFLFRQQAAKEFSDLYIFDLASDLQRNPKISDTTHHVLGIQPGVGIGVFVRKNIKFGQCGVQYSRREINELVIDKLANLSEAKFDRIAFEGITSVMGAGKTDSVPNDHDNVLHTRVAP